METKTARIIENPVIKDRVIFLETAAETKGRYSLLEVELSPNGGNEMHIHKKFDETFTVVKGVLGVQVGDQILHLEPGETCTAYVGQAHRFFNPSDTEKVTFTVMIQPGSTSFERSLQVVYGLSRDGLTTAKGMPKNIYHLGLLMVWSDTHFPGMGRWMEPLLRWAARLAVKKGIDRQLKDSYCLY
ncbi:MAG TPA: cupin domain-containing protein [Saprospiraceae bacterium]|nr:cupin domain-containing protein [Saprospiraceae bacterium]HPI06519.1 cupin domain-containing protein [Saprospiraceae bacterium]